MSSHPPNEGPPATGPPAANEAPPWTIARQANRVGRRTASAQLDMAHRPAPPRPDTGLVAFHTSILATSCAVVAAALLLHVEQKQYVVVPWVNRPLPGVCTFHNLTGYDCPGCGLTRSVISMAHGSWSAAWHYNAAGVLFFGVILFQIPYRIAQLWRCRKGRAALQLGTVDQWVAMVLVAALLVQWLIKLVTALRA